MSNFINLRKKAIYRLIYVSMLTPNCNYAPPPLQRISIGTGVTLNSYEGSRWESTNETSTQVWRELGAWGSLLPLKFQCRLMVVASEKPMVNGCCNNAKLLKKYWKTGDICCHPDSRENHRFLTVINVFWWRAAWDIVNKHNNPLYLCNNAILTCKFLKLYRERIILVCIFFF